jgi:hypothetical protein
MFNGYICLNRYINECLFFYTYLHVTSLSSNKTQLLFKEKTSFRLFSGISGQQIGFTFNKFDTTPCHGDNT